MKIGEICEFVYGDSLPQQKREKGNIPVYGSNGRIDYHNKSLVNDETIIVGRKGSIGEVHFSSVGCWIIDTAYYIRPLIKLEVKYLFYLLKHLNLSKLNKASSIPGLNRDDVYKIDIDLPSLDEQKRIVKIIETKLYAAEKAKEANDERLSIIDKLLDAYVENIHNNKDWNKVKLGDIAEITSSKRVFEHEWKTSGIPFYRAREIVKLAKQGYVDNEIFISEQQFEEYIKKYGKPHENDIMITGVGTLGVCYLVKRDDKFYFKDGNVIWVKNIDGSVIPSYLYHVLNSKFIQNQIISFSAGNTVGTYTIENAKKTIIPLPSIDEQNRIVEFIESKRNIIENIKIKTGEQSTYINNLSSSILRKAFNGEY